MAAYSFTSIVDKVHDDNHDPNARQDRRGQLQRCRKECGGPSGRAFRTGSLNSSTLLSVALALQPGRPMPLVADTAQHRDFNQTSTPSS
jgi:hypothetical protein